MFMSRPALNNRKLNLKNTPTALSKIVYVYRFHCTIVRSHCWNEQFHLLIVIYIIHGHIYSLLLL